jgi:hypothetical protein
MLRNTSNGGSNASATYSFRRSDVCGDGQGRAIVLIDDEAVPALELLGPRADFISEVDRLL